MFILKRFHPALFCLFEFPSLFRIFNHVWIFEISNDFICDLSFRSSITSSILVAKYQNEDCSCFRHNHCHLYHCQHFMWWSGLEEMCLKMILTNILSTLIFHYLKLQSVLFHFYLCYLGTRSKKYIRKKFILKQLFSLDNKNL